MRKPHDYWSARQLKWIVLGMVVLIVVAGIAVWLAEHEPSKLAFHKYLDAIAAGRIDDAYEQLCPESKQAMPDYVERVNAVLAEIGRIEGRSDLSATRTGRGAAFIDGARMDILVFIRLTEVDDTWRACPTEGPLGRVEAA